MRPQPLQATLRRQWSADLTPAQLYGLLRLRGEVFVVEQSCAYNDLDGRDLEPGTRHFWLEAEGGDPLACLRLLEEADGGFRIGRVCTARAARGRGCSRRLVEAALVEVGDRECVLDAQTYVVDFYASFGFQPEGAEFIEDGIPHLRMRRSP
ncbi:GNAT family N-acetyltransferase [Saccharothrix coeruleofusca]|uniref:ElaA protein n=1 Tax=Saccharothrix coeruleofusca TaxID=33919 RepID=A0A918ED35_9PSEU|nr:GNAT family N-acetyltransferase [Saccharothrix coeruleofusca]MBP2338464.1 ElaA protein [Saccharothrix coeruleofusca]GGP48215.1 ElaA protein [Saccharothrix coeruleofusca]